MNYTTTMTSKGQITIPIAIRKKLGLQPGAKIKLSSSANKVVAEKDDWFEKLKEIQAFAAAHRKQHNLPVLSDKELDKAVNESAEEGATASYERSLKS